jgi:hypothetical protein
VADSCAEVTALGESAALRSAQLRAAPRCAHLARDRDAGGPVHQVPGAASECQARVLGRDDVVAHRNPALDNRSPQHVADDTVGTP